VVVDFNKREDAAPHRPRHYWPALLAYSISPRLPPSKVSCPDSRLQTVNKDAPQSPSLCSPANSSSCAADEVVALVIPLSSVRGACFCFYMVRLRPTLLQDAVLPKHAYQGTTFPPRSSDYIFWQYLIAFSSLV
jgi:hypothetical protein